MRGGGARTPAAQGAVLLVPRGAGSTPPEATFRQRWRRGRMPRQPAITAKSRPTTLVEIVHSAIDQLRRGEQFVMGLRRIGIVEIRVEDWAAAVKWYTETLGLEAEVLEHEDEYGWLSPPEGDARIALYSARRVHDSRGKSRCLPCFEVEDITETMRELRQRGVEVLNGPTVSEEGYTSADIVDLEGNVIELYEFAEA